MFARIAAAARPVAAQRIAAAANVNCVAAAQVQVVRRNFASEKDDDVAAGQEFLLHFATPYDLFYNKAQIHEITIPTVGGNYTLGVNSAPYVAQLKPGRVVVYRHEGDEGDAYVIPGGFFVVNRDSSVSLSVPEALPVDQIDIDKARAGLAAARKLQSESGGATEETKINQFYGDLGEEVYSEVVAAYEMASSNA